MAMISAGLGVIAAGILLTLNAYAAPMMFAATTIWGLGIGGNLLLGNCDARLISPNTQVSVRRFRGHGNPNANLLGDCGLR